MSAASAIYDNLIGDATVIGIVGNKIYPNGQPKQDAQPPFIFFEVVTAQRPAILSGVCPLKNYQFRITSVCTSEPQLRMLMDGVENKLDGLKNGKIRGCQLNDDNTNPNPEMPTEFSDSQTFSVWYARDYVGANN